MTETDILLVDTTSAVKSLDAAADSTDKLGKKQKDLADFMRKDMEDAFTSAQAKYDLIKSGAKAFYDVLKTGVTDSLAAQEQAMRLTHAINNAGYASNNFQKSLDAQSAALERLTGHQDEEISAMQAMLIGMGVAKGDIERVTKAAYDMAAATGTSATLAARMLARASAEGKEELKRYGITVKDTNTELEGFQATLQEVEKRFGGIHEQMPEQLKQINELKGAWNSFSEAMGGFILSIGAGTTAGGKGILVTALDDWAKSLRALTDEGLLVGLAKLQMVMSGAADASLLFSPLAGGVQTITESDEQLLRKKIKEQMAKAAADRANAGVGEKFLAGGLENKEHEHLAKKAKEVAHKLWLKKMEDHQHETDRLVALEEKRGEALAGITSKWGASQKAQDDAFDAEREEAAASVVNDKLERETEFWRRKMRLQERAQEEEKQRMQEMANFAKEIGGALLQFSQGLLKEAILSDSAYTRAHQEQILKQMTMGMKKEDADRKRAETEKEWAEENEANLKKKTADVLADIAVQAATKAVFATAEGIASAAGFNEASAAGFFAAAGMYAAIAVASGAGAYALNSGRGMTKDEKASLNSNQEAFERSRSQREASQAAQRGGSTVQGTVINVIHMGLTGQTEVEQARELDRIHEKYSASKTGGDI